MNTNKILIADDEPYVARVLKLVLQKAGYEVTCVDNGRQAIEAYMNIHPDIVITDVKMPQMTGRELVENIRGSKDGHNTPVVVMTSTLESENRDWVTGVDNVLFLGKPVSPRDLVKVVNGYFTHSKAS